MPYSPDLSRRDDPQTSAAAADYVTGQGLDLTHEFRILAVLRAMPEGGTGKEIAAAVMKRFRVRTTSVQVMRRMRSLLDHERAFRRHDPDEPWVKDSRGRTVANWQRREGQAIHFLTRGDMPLFGE